MPLSLRQAITAQLGCLSQLLFSLTAIMSHATNPNTVTWLQKHSLPYTVSTKWHILSARNGVCGCCNSQPKPDSNLHRSIGYFPLPTFEIESQTQGQEETACHAKKKRHVMPCCMAGHDAVRH